MKKSLFPMVLALALIVSVPIWGFIAGTIIIFSYYKD